MPVWLSVVVVTPFAAVNDVVVVPSVSFCDDEPDVTVLVLLSVELAEPVVVVETTLPSTVTVVVLFVVLDVVLSLTVLVVDVDEPLLLTVTVVLLCVLVLPPVLFETVTVCVEPSADVVVVVVSVKLLDCLTVDCPWVVVVPTDVLTFVMVVIVCVPPAVSVSCVLPSACGVLVSLKFCDVVVVTVVPFLRSAGHRLRGEGIVAAVVVRQRVGTAGRPAVVALRRRRIGERVVVLLRIGERRRPAVETARPRFVQIDGVVAIDRLRGAVRAAARTIQRRGLV